MSKRRKIHVNTELAGVVNKLIERGFKVTFTSCDTYDIDLGNPQSDKVTLIQIEFSEWYPDEMLNDLPSGWIKYEYRKANNGRISDTRYSAISCSERHPLVEMDEEDIAFARMLMISSLESWLDEIDPEGFKAVWIFKTLY